MKLISTEVGMGRLSGKVALISGGGHADKENQRHDCLFVRVPK